MVTIMHHKLNRSVFITVMIVLTIGACSKPPRLTIENVHAEFSPAMRDESAVYLVIRNDGGKDILMNAKIDIPGASADIHEMRGGMMILTNALQIPAKSTTELGPLGSHIMITHLPGEVKAGSRFTLTLEFKKSGAILVPVQFTPPSPRPMVQERHH